MGTEYYLKSGNDKLGPFSESQIIKGIRSGKISLFDTIFNSQLSTWVMVMQHPDFCDIEVSSSASAESDKGESSYSTSTDSIQIGLTPENFEADLDLSMELGQESDVDLGRPYWFEKSSPQKSRRYLEVLSLLNSKKFSEHTLLAKKPEGPWKPLIEWEDFSEKSISEFRHQTREEIPDVVIRRKHPRFECGKNFILAAQGKAFKAFCPDISKSGMAFVVKDLKATMGESLHIKFNDDLHGNTFDAKGVVVGIRKIRVSDMGVIYFRYSLRFTHLSESGKVRLSVLTSEETVEK